MPKKESKFDRVKTGKEAGKMVMKEIMTNKKSPWSKDRAMTMAIGSGSGSMATDIAGGTGAISKVADKAKGAMKGLRKGVQESNRLDAIGKSKGIHKVKTIFKGKKSYKYTRADENEVSTLRAKDAFSKREGSLRDVKETSENGFTSRGKPIGKKIQDRGGEMKEHQGKKRLNLNIQAARNKEINYDNKINKIVSEHRKKKFGK